jgi:hypothetical protein
MEELRPEVRADDDGTAWLTLVGKDERTRAVFDEQGWDGNGYDWGEVGQALALMKMSDQVGQLFFDPEADYLLVLGSNRALIEEFAEWLQAAFQDPKLLVEAMRFGEEHGLDGCTHP